MPLAVARRCRSSQLPRSGNERVDHSAHPGKIKQLTATVKFDARQGLAARCRANACTSAAEPNQPAPASPLGVVAARNTRRRKTPPVKPLLSQQRQ
jgi:hypothetical protein